MENRNRRAAARGIESEHGALPGLIDTLRQLLFPNAAFAQKKFGDHRRFTAVMLVILAVFLPMLWAWDYVTDRIGAQNTIGLRLMFLLLLPVAAGFWSGKARRGFLEVAMPLALLAAEAMFVEILNRLDTGWVFGLAGFMYCMFITILIGQCLSLARGMAYMLMAAALPQLMALAGLAPGLAQAHYSALLWPAAGLAILSQTVFAIEYLRRYRLESQLQQQSETDPLSGIGNRRFFMRRLREEVARARRLAQPLSLLMLDIDHFKRINDTHGHLLGDVVIGSLADALCDGVRDIDVVARIGGEEFAVLLLGSATERAARIAERIRVAAESSVVSLPDGRALHYTVSIGVAQLQPEDTHDLNVFGRADTALYAAKAGGRNRVVSG